MVGHWKSKTDMTAEFFIELNEDGSPWLTQHTQALPEHRVGLSHWALPIAANDNYSDALIHVYYHGESPSDEVLDRVMMLSSGFLVCDGIKVPSF